jgi:2-iminobutanoate/2-iminopropanoate deaminase
MKEIIYSNSAPAPIGPYSQATSAGGLLFISGQIALDATTGEFINYSIEAETQKVLSNIRTILNEAGADWNNVVKTTIFLKNMDDFAMVNQVYGSVFTGLYPARETVEVSRLPKDAQVEISVIAVL